MHHHSGNRFEIGAAQAKAIRRTATSNGIELTAKGRSKHSEFRIRNLLTVRKHSMKEISNREAQKAKDTATVEENEMQMSRRRMIGRSAAALIGVSMIGRATGATTKTDIGDTAPHVNFSLQGKSAFVTGAARGIGRAIAVAL